MYCENIDKAWNLNIEESKILEKLLDPNKETNNHIGIVEILTWHPNGVEHVLDIQTCHHCINQKADRGV